MSGLHLAARATVEAVFLYAALTEMGFVKIGISRKPHRRIYDVHCGSPSAVRAAQWIWIGSLDCGREMEREIRQRWAARHMRGEWYFFDYDSEADRREFHETLNTMVAERGAPYPWKKLGPEDVEGLKLENLKSGNRSR